MKTALRLFLTIIAIPTFLTLLILISIKFQLLNNDYWTESLKRNNIAGNVESSLRRIVSDSEYKKEIDRNEARTISSLITKENVESTLSGNIKNTLNYLNGVDAEWKVFIPVDKLPKNLLPTFIQGSNEVSLQTILSFYNRGQEEQVQLPSQLNTTGQSVLLSLIIFTIILFVILTALFILTDPGKRFTWVALPLLISSIILAAVSFAFSINHLQIADQLRIHGTEPSQILIGATIPYILKDIANLWTQISAVVLALAFIILFFKKPMSGKTKRI